LCLQVFGLYRPIEWIATPDLENQVAPEGAHVAGGLLGRWRDEEDLGGWWWLRREIGFRRTDDPFGDERCLAAGLVRVEAVVADRLLALGREMEEGGGDEVGGFEDLEVPLGGVVALGAVDDGLGCFVPSDFLKGEGMAEEIFGEAFAAGAVVGGDGLFFGADELGFAEGVEEAVAEEFDGWVEVFGGHAVEAAVWGEKTVGGEDVEVGVEDQIVAEGVDGGDGSEFAFGEVEAGAEGVAEGFGGGVEEVGEEMTSFAEDAAEDAGDGEDELAVGDFVADSGGDPVAGGADAPLVAGRAEVAAFAGEGEEALVAAIGALEAGEAGGEVATAEERFNGGSGGGVERAEGLAVFGFVVGEEVVPAVVDELPKGRGAGAAGLVDGRHKKCS